METSQHGNAVCIATVYPKKYAHGFVVLCFAVVMQSFIMNSHEVFIHIHQGCFAGTGAIVRLPQCQWSKLDGYGKISQCITTTKHSKAKTVCIFLGIYCSSMWGESTSEWLIPIWLICSLLVAWIHWWTNSLNELIRLNAHMTSPYWYILVQHHPLYQRHDELYFICNDSIFIWNLFFFNPTFHIGFCNWPYLCEIKYNHKQYDPVVIHDWCFKTSVAIRSALGIAASDLSNTGSAYLRHIVAICHENRYQGVYRRGSYQSFVLESNFRYRTVSSGQCLVSVEPCNIGPKPILNQYLTE